ncbi:MAG TPA: type II toxin-antitoxin system RelE/ParE family toxin [Polyangia bacterium]|nr:type II toxin-antitoxin system RelE/ParE family toxin [Polyangia bacterium]
MKIAFAPEAVEDLAAVLEYLVERNPRAAAATADAVFAVMDRLAAGEFEGPERELGSTGERVRSWPVRPYRIFYSRESETLTILRVHHSARRPISR